MTSALLPVGGGEYFFRLFNGHWAFLVTHAVRFTEILVQAERWRCGDEIYALCLRCYSKPEAEHLILSAGTRLMQGPEIYYVMKRNGINPLLVAYKPDMTDTIELQGYGDFSNEHTQVTPDISYDAIKREMQRLLRLENVIVEAKSEDRLCAIQYNF